ncbi:MAG TPA: ABC transporter substrate-binding protein, partial [Actinomycetota bacterium]
MRKRKLFSLLALIAALSLVAAACGGDDDDDGGVATGETPAATDGGGEDPCAADEFGCAEVAAGDPIRLGSLLAISGDVAFLGTDSNNGIILAIDNLDGSLDATPGQLLEHDIDLQQEDDGCSAEGGAAGAQALIGDPTIVAVIGTSCSSAALGVADEVTSEVGMLLFSPSNTNPALTGEGTHQAFYARTAHNDRIQGAIAAEFVFNELGIDTAATINDESPYADGLAAAFRTNFEALGGTITAQEQVNSGDTDLGPVLRGIAEGNPGVVYGPNFNPVCALTYSQGA